MCKTKAWNTGTDTYVGVAVVVYGDSFCKKDLASEGVRGRGVCVCVAGNGFHVIALGRMCIVVAFLFEGATLEVGPPPSCTG